MHRYNIKSLKNSIVIDSSLSLSEILRQNPGNICPQEVLDGLVVLEVEYVSFDGKIHTGQIAIHRDLVDDIAGAFNLLAEEKFPIQSVIPISDERFLWDDTISTTVNNTSAFNYRFVRNTSELSNHSFGRAIDINPKLNPYFPGNLVFPVDSSYDPKVTGTILKDSNLVRYFKDLGWVWGGDWVEDPDYQHFEKLS